MITIRKAQAAGTVLLVLLAAGQGCEEKPDGPVRPGLPVPEQRFRDARIVMTEDGRTSVIVEARRVDIWESRNYSVLEDSVVIDMFDKEGEQVSRLTAQLGEVWGENNDIDSLRATGDVLIVWQQRDARMETPFIHLDAVSHMIYADSLNGKTVRLTIEGGIQEGIRFEATDDLKTWKMEQVTGEIRNEQLVIPER